MKRSFKLCSNFNVMQEIKEELERRKQELLPELYSWPSIFLCGEYDDDKELTFEAYEEVSGLIKRFEYGQCSPQDLNNLIFHIHQINYEEQVIILETITLPSECLLDDYTFF